MSGRLARLCAAHGVLPEYEDIAGAIVRPPEDALRAILAALGVDPDAADAADAGDGALAIADRPRAPEGRRCHLPGFLEAGRAWGVACQLYSLRSERNWGIGDFDDLARFGETAAGFGADFVGVNPLHALFLAMPESASPFYPSDRDQLNALYIAVDRVEGYDPADADPARLAALRGGELVDYPAVAAEKLRVLRRIHGRVRADPPTADELAFVADGGPALRRYALFEALSLHMAAEGHGAGWQGWPEAYRDPEGAAVAAFADACAEAVDFHIWLQWVADRQLAAAAERLRRAGMRIGLYLDLAVGVAPGGAATWADRALTVVEAEIGAPPDMFNMEGQGWGLAPTSTHAIVARDFAPVRRAYAVAMRHAGALRIDHAMGLFRLFWIPQGFSPKEGAYVVYPMERTVEALAEASRDGQTVVIGEDLGVLPVGFRDEMERAGILGYRVWYFERDGGGFVAPERWPRAALACVGSHDTPTLAGWWTGRDIETRAGIGVSDPTQAEAEQAARAGERREALALVRSRWPETAAGEAFGPAVAVAVHRLVAAAPSRLMAVQLEDLLGLPDQVNVPGTVDEHPNWRRRNPVPVEALEQVPLLRDILHAIAEERPRAP